MRRCVHRLPRHLLLGALFLAGMLLTDLQIRRARAAAKAGQGGGTEMTSPLVDFVSVSLGGFRGVLVDALWLRASFLQESGRYLELVQLADWIARLEPEAPEVWAYHAWNLAYNVSVMMVRPEERWRWVQHGLALLRDEGLRHAPEDPNLYRELSWMFLHKICGVGDDTHTAYKRFWAAEMSALMPDGRPPAPGSPEAERLRRDFRLEVAEMLALDARYAPFDWRLPQTQAVFWADRGLRYTPPDDPRGARTVYQALAACVQAGRLQAWEGDQVKEAPHLGLIAPTQALFETTITRGERFASATVAYAYFLGRVVPVWYVAGRPEEARAAYDRLISLAPDAALVPSFEAIAEGHVELGDLRP